jgi:photosystem II stability/assembly factor-like uncharacterized protein
MIKKKNFFIRLFTFLLVFAFFLSCTGRTQAGSFNIWNNSELIGPAVSQWQFLAMSEDGSYISGTTANSQIYTSSNHGATFTPRAGNRSWFGIEMSHNGQYQTAVEMNGYIYTSSNYGVSWSAGSIEKLWLDVGVSADGKYQTAVSNNVGVPLPQYQGSVYISQDYGSSWTEVAALSGQTYGNVAISDTGQYQILSDATGRVLYSDNYGQDWNEVLQTPTAYIQSLALSGDGSYMTAVEDGGNIWISSDGGSNWTEISNTKDWRAVTMSSDGKYQLAVSIADHYAAISKDYGQTWAQIMSTYDYEWTAATMSGNGDIQLIASYVSGDGSRIYKSSANCELSYTSGSNGSLEGDLLQTVDYGDDGTEITAVPETGYEFLQWSDGVTDNPRLDTAVTENVDVTAEFDLITHTVINIPPGQKVELPNDDYNIEEGIPDGEAVDLYFLDENNHRIGSANVVFNEDLDVSNVDLAMDHEQKKSFLHNLNREFTLYIPKGEQDNMIYICPGASSLEMVTSSCPDVVELNANSTNVEIVTIGEREYWAVSGLEGTGGLSAGNLADTGTPLYFSLIGILYLLVNKKLFR